jgi:uncharacterized protein (TIGR02246 family)
MSAMAARPYSHPTEPAGDKMGERECGARPRTALLSVMALALAIIGSAAASNASSTTGSAPTQRSSARDGDEAPIRALATQMTDAWNRGNASDFAAVFAEDGELISGDGTRSVGRQEIERYTARLLMKPTQFTASVIGVRFIDRDVALWTADGGFLRPGETVIAPGQRGIQSLVVRRDTGRWRVVLLQRTRIPVPVQIP